MTAEGPRAAVTDDTVKIITDRLAEEIGEVNRLLRESLDSESDLIREVGEFVAFTGGKKLRPLLLLLSARAMAPERPPPVEVAAAVELIHVATLIHDDVIDKATMRRGKPSVNAKWGDDVAILMADYLYASAFELALQHLDPKPLRIICEVTRRMCEGEMFQIEKRGRWLTPEDYLHVITRKTAYLFSASAAMGALAGGLPPEAVAQASAFGLDFGLAFQVTDDTLDFTADPETWGKSIGIDLASGRQTLPIILALRHASEADRQKLEIALENGRDLAQVKMFLDRYDAIPRSLEVAQNYCSQCLGHIAGFEIRNSMAHDFIQMLPEYVVARRS